MTNAGVSYYQKLRFLSGREAAEYLGISKTLLYDMARDGKVPFLTIGSRKKFRPDELDVFFRSPLMKEIEKGGNA